MRIRSFIIIFSLFLPLTIYSANSKENRGNFALSGSQQPGPLLGLGQNIIDKHQGQVYLFADNFVGVAKHSTDLIPYIVYGLSDDLSLAFAMPMAPSFKTDDDTSSGLQDIIFQCEYAFYKNTTTEYADQATIFANVTLPTGSSKALPSTGFGSPSFFLGTTIGRIYAQWLAFSAYGVSLKTSQFNTQFGNQYYYQFGLGKNLFTIDSKLIVAMIVEMDGQYSDKNKISGQMDLNSGGNIIFVTPSIWISTYKFIFQFGAGLPAAQHLFGEQKRFNYVLSSSVGWTF